jgi:hypothetical protein
MADILHLHIGTNRPDAHGGNVAMSVLKPVQPSQKQELRQHYAVSAEKSMPATMKPVNIINTIDILDTRFAAVRYF